MNEPISLCGVSEGAKCTVRSIFNEGAMRRRLQDIGLIEGTEILCLNRSPSGDPTAYLIRGAVIALRKEETEKILVTQI